MNKQECIDFLKKEARNLFYREIELKKRRRQIEKQLNQLLDEQALERAKQGRVI